MSKEDQVKRQLDAAKGGVVAAAQELTLEQVMEQVKANFPKMQANRGLLIGIFPQGEAEAPVVATSVVAGASDGTGIFLTNYTKEFAEKCPTQWENVAYVNFKGNALELMGRRVQVHPEMKGQAVAKVKKAGAIA